MGTLNIEQLVISGLRFYYGIQYPPPLSLRLSVAFLRIVFLPLAKKSNFQKNQIIKTQYIFLRNLGF